MNFLVEIIAAAKAAGARRFRVADTLSVLDPFATYALIAALRKTTDLELESMPTTISGSRPRTRSRRSRRARRTPR